MNTKLHNPEIQHRFTTTEDIEIHPKYRLRTASREQMGRGNLVMTMDTRGSDHRMTTYRAVEMARVLIDELETIEKTVSGTTEQKHLTRVFLADSSSQYVSSMTETLNLRRPDIMATKVKYVKNGLPFNDAEAGCVTVTELELGAAYSQIVKQLEDQAVHYGDFLYDDLPNRSSVLTRAAALYLADNADCVNERWILVETGRAQSLRSAQLALEVFDASTNNPANVASHLSHIACGLVLR